MLKINEKHEMQCINTYNNVHKLLLLLVYGVRENISNTRLEVSKKRTRRMTLSFGILSHPDNMILGCELGEALILNCL